MRAGLLGAVRVLRVGRADAVRQARGAGRRVGICVAGSPARAEARAGEARGGEESAGVRPRRTRRGRANERHEARRGERRPDATARSRARGVPLAILVRLDVTQGGNGRDVRGYLRKEGRTLSHRARASRVYPAPRVERVLKCAVEEKSRVAHRRSSGACISGFTDRRRVPLSEAIGDSAASSRRHVVGCDETPPGVPELRPNSPRVDARIAFPRKVRRVPRVTHD